VLAAGVDFLGVALRACLGVSAIPETTVAAFSALFVGRSSIVGEGRSIMGLFRSDAGYARSAVPARSTIVTYDTHLRSSHISGCGCVVSSCVCLSRFSPI